jgi:inosose dehydratase
VHVHLKDVDAALAAEVRSGRVAYGDAIWQGLFRPLGAGDVDVAALVRLLEDAGYDGWYVLEQDIKLAGEPQDDGPATGVHASLDYLRSVLS